MSTPMDEMKHTAVKRFWMKDVDEGGYDIETPYMAESEYGEYVLFGDYDALHRQLEQVRGALEKLLARAERETCHHEETMRRGAIWEVCLHCNAEWADDEGGKPEFVEPSEIVEARAALTEVKHEQR